jgi:hypothetical protein
MATDPVVPQGPVKAMQQDDPSLGLLQLIEGYEAGQWNCR